jgi:hypothetical protein
MITKFLIELQIFEVLRANVGKAKTKLHIILNDTNTCVPALPNSITNSLPNMDSINTYCYIMRSLWHPIAHSISTLPSNESQMRHSWSRVASFPSLARQNFSVVFSDLLITSILSIRASWNKTDVKSIDKHPDLLQLRGNLISCP